MIDASVVVDAFAVAGSAGRAAKQAIRLIGPMHAPYFLRAETTQALRRMEIHRSITPQRAIRALHGIRRLQVDLHPIEPHLPRIWELRPTLSVYDAWYVALAERLDTTLVTADSRLARAPGPICTIQVI